MKPYRRTTLTRVSKHQKVFFYPVMVAFFLGCIVSWLTVIYFLIGDTFTVPALIKFYKTIPILLIVATFSMFLVLFWTFRISNRYLGSFERLINDLDSVIEGDRKEGLVTRENDVIFIELLKRINILIQGKSRV